MALLTHAPYPLSRGDHFCHHPTDLGNDRDPTPGQRRKLLRLEARSSPRFSVNTTRVQKVAGSPTANLSSRGALTLAYSKQREAVRGGRRLGTHINNNIRNVFDVWKRTSKVGDNTHPAGKSFLEPVSKTVVCSDIRGRSAWLLFFAGPFYRRLLCN
jgi:hypothetical protein